MNATRTINFYGEEAQVIAEALARKDAEIESLRQQLVDYQTKHDVACLTINMLQEKCDIRGRALSLQCKETKELRQQLAAAQASPTIEACRQMIEAKAVKENQELHNKLAAALAAIKVKDAFIERVAKQTPEKPDYWSPCGQCERNTSEAEDLLTIQPDDNALKAWIGEPVAWLHENRPEADVITDAVKNVWTGVVVGKDSVYSIPLYAPKGLK